LLNFDIPHAFLPLTVAKLLTLKNSPVFCPPWILRTDRWPTTDLSFGKISNGHISVRGRPMHFMFGCTVGFSGSADRMALFPVWQNPRWPLGCHPWKFKWRYLRDRSSDLFHIWF